MLLLIAIIICAQSPVYMHFPFVAIHHNHVLLKLDAYGFKLLTVQLSHSFLVCARLFFQANRPYFACVGLLSEDRTEVMNNNV